MERAAKVGQAPAPLGMGIRCCHDEWGLACDEWLLFWVTPSGDIPARRDVEHAQWRMEESFSYHRHEDNVRVRHSIC